MRIRESGGGVEPRSWPNLPRRAPCVNESRRAGPDGPAPTSCTGCRPTGTAEPFPNTFEDCCFPPWSATIPTVARDADDSLAVVVYREDGMWQSDVLPGKVSDDLDGLIGVLRQQPGENGAIGLVNVADEFFVAVRVRGEDVRVLLSDVTAAVAWDLARQVIDRLGLQAPAEEEVEDIWPAGDLAMFSDFGLDELELGVVLADIDAYADEMLVTLAGRIGFGEVYDRAVEAAAP
jgi:putative tRNA adenosine deaminase-associated protein